MDEPNAKDSMELAARRLEQIMAVLKGERSATQAAAALGVSRQTFYEWYNRALITLQDSLTDRVPGRPTHPPPDPERARLQHEISQLQREVDLLKNAILIRDVMEGVPRFPVPDSDVPPTSRSKKKP